MSNRNTKKTKRGVDEEPERSSVLERYAELEKTVKAVRFFHDLLNKCPGIFSTLVSQCPNINAAEFDLSSLEANEKVIVSFIETSKRAWLNLYGDMVADLRHCEQDRAVWKAQERERVVQEEQLRRVTIDDQVALLKADAVRLNEQLAECQTQQDLDEARINKLQSDLAAEKAGAEQKVEQEVARIRANAEMETTSNLDLALANSKLAAELAERDTALALEVEKNVSLTSSLRAAKAATKRALANLDRAQNTIDSLTKKNLAYEVAANEKDEEIRRLQAEVRRLDEWNETQRQINDKSEEIIRGHLENLDKIYKEEAQLITSEQASTKKYDALKKECDELREDFVTLENEYDILQQDLKESDEKRRTFSLDWDECQEERGILQERIDDLLSQIVDLEKKLSDVGGGDIVVEGEDERTKPLRWEEDERTKALRKQLEEARKKITAMKPLYYEWNAEKSEFQTPELPPNQEDFQFYAIRGRPGVLGGITWAIRNLKDENDRLTGKSQAQNDAINELQNKVNELSITIKELRVNESNWAHAEDEQRKADNKLKAAESQINGLKQQVANLERDVSSQKTSADNVSRQLELIKEQKDNANALLLIGAPDLQALRSQISVLHLEVATQKLYIDALRNQIRDQQVDIGDQQASMNNLDDLTRATEELRRADKAEADKLRSSLTNIRAFFDDWNRVLRSYKKFELNVTGDDLQPSTISIRTATEMIILRTKKAGAERDDREEFLHILKYYRFVARLLLYESGDVRRLRPLSDSLIDQGSANFALIRRSDLDRLEGLIHSEEELARQEEARGGTHTLLLSSLDLSYKAKMLSAHLSSTPVVSKRAETCSVTLAFATAERGDQLQLMAHGVAAQTLPNSKRRAYIVHMPKLTATNREYLGFGTLVKDHIHPSGTLRVTLSGVVTPPTPLAYRFDAREARYGEELLVKLDAGVDLYARYVDGNCYRLDTVVVYL